MDRAFGLRTSRPLSIIAFVRRLVAIAAAVGVAASSVAYAASMNCPAMRARALSHCCCPQGAAEQARLTCCTTSAESSAVPPSPRVQTDRPHFAPNTAVVADVQPADGLQVPVTAFSRALLAS